MQNLNNESSIFNNSQGSVDRQRYIDLENFPKENHVVLVLAVPIHFFTSNLTITKLPGLIICVERKDNNFLLAILRLKNGQRRR